MKCTKFIAIEINIKVTFSKAHNVFSNRVKQGLLLTTESYEVHFPVPLVLDSFHHKTI